MPEPLLEDGEEKPLHRGMEGFQFLDPPPDLPLLARVDRGQGNQVADVAHGAQVDGDPVQDQAEPRAVEVVLEHVPKLANEPEDLGVAREVGVTWMQCNFRHVPCAPSPFPLSDGVRTR